MDYKTVYEVSEEWMKFHWVLTLLILLVGFRLFWYQFFEVEEDTVERARGVFAGFFMTIFGLLTTVLLVWNQIPDYFETQSIYRNGRYQIVEGPVEDFVPMPVSGHALESFCVDGEYFNYSDFDEVNYGFNNTASHGGPIDHNGQELRLAYITKGKHNIILRIETREQ